eukprot:TRINITY_DN8065_c0_g1_i2.p1 TRINITY_DN8065_c0_g1~~TRINITY_DN8065_c0_g1_i2.p1  ORF type:complete len:271 (-),score=70.18 TRINITY_DN8065_c0_g1_i2:204-1016(-)
MLFCYTLSDSFVDPSLHIDKRILLFKYFGTFTRSFVSWFELTFGNWVPISRFLQEEIGEQYAWYILVFRFVVGFSVVMVLRAVFISETLRAAQNDDEVLLLQKNRQVQMHTQKMELFFHQADESADGYVSLEEFKTIMKNKNVQKWLQAQEINVTDCDLVFNLVKPHEEGGEARLSAEELVKGLSRIKGPAKSMDMVAVHYTVDRLESRVNDLCNHLMVDRRRGISRSMTERIVRTEVTDTESFSPSRNRQQEASDIIQGGQTGTGKGKE